MTKLPKKVIVKSVCSSRYGACSDGSCSNKCSDRSAISTVKVQVGEKPLNWDDRISGKDEVVVYTESDCSNSNPTEETIILNSLGDQSTPAPGWVLMLTGGNAELGYSWTLYGFKRDSAKRTDSQAHCHSDSQAHCDSDSQAHCH